MGRTAPPGIQGVPLRGLIRVVLLLVLVAGAAVTAPAAERNPVAHAPRAQARPGSVERLIVRLRASPAAAGETAAAAHARLASLATRSELALESSRAISGDIHALRVRLAPGASLADTLARLRQDPQVEYAELDQRRFAHAVPNDPLYPQQWFLMPSSAVTPSAIDAQTAWSTTTGSPSLVIADIDTGVRF